MTTFVEHAGCRASWRKLTKENHVSGAKVFSCPENFRHAIVREI